MSHPIEVTMLPCIRLCALAALFLVPCLAPAKATRELGSPKECAFQEGGRIRIKLSAGEYRIVPVQGNNKIVVRWATDCPEDHGRVRVDVETRGAEATIRAKGTWNDFQAEIQVPAHTNLDVDLTVGELHIQGIDGSKFVDCNIGEVRINVPDPQAYRSATASVKVGTLQASAFKEHQDGLFNSMRWRGDGKHDLDVRLGIGEVHLK